MVDKKGSAPNTQKNRGKSHKKLIVGLIIVIIVIGALYYLYETYGSLPASAISMMASGHALNATSLQALMLQKIVSTPNFRANYSGSMQVTIVNMGNGADSGKLYYILQVSKLQQLGNLTLQYSQNYVGLKNYSNPNLCVLTDNLQIIQKVGAAEQNIMICKNPQEHPRFSGTVVNLLVNISSLDNININSYGISSYNGEPCYSVSGNGTIDVNSTIVGANSGPDIPAKMNFSTCLSAQYNLPFYLNAQIVPTNGSKILIALKDYSMGPFSVSTGQANLP